MKKGTAPKEKKVENPKDGSGILAMLAHKVAMEEPASSGGGSPKKRGG